MSRGKKALEADTFDKVLQLLRLKAKQLCLMIELVESLAYKAAREDVGLGKPTTIQEQAIFKDKLFDYVPWDFVLDTKFKNPALTRRAQRTKFDKLKNHVKQLKEILDSVRFVGDTSMSRGIQEAEL